MRNANKLQAIAAQLAGFKPTLDTAIEDVPAGIGNTLVLLGGMADYMNNEISVLAERLSLIGGTA
ncbi:hypothetical protein QN382_12345 [Pseudomonas sp. 10B1]|uniref:hypothetical protein n=1 Tax=unclassified Pseudomonas TaxID=196821 RepID=UPI002B2368E6|nr:MULTISPECIES: hypothetical protein [unclassified Pseudomonas]MEA9996275.1 hypothetical protein [Pseudomonas sp. AA4]MEB0086683.1 hypothetical protein [Pseudomonas sp. RTI1]MEB0124733.1 hypothetical protein [Pseudomonas sp. CCC1.2]MEB0154894.1 hypothetical protein [Pseudomonas sp. CCC4.3]MEB0217894.1 hypothetical protein [Pseudomonas sp. AB12(2023)]